MNKYCLPSHSVMEQIEQPVPGEKLDDLLVRIDKEDEALPLWRER